MLGGGKLHTHLASRILTVKEKNSFSLTIKNCKNKEKKWAKTERSEIELNKHKKEIEGKRQNNIRNEDKITECPKSIFT